MFSRSIRNMLVVVIFVNLIGWLSSQAVKPKAQVAALWNFGEVAECVLHYNPLVYNNYGCWCGVGGSHEPVDEIDRCCFHHDKCYDAAIDNKICFDVPFEYIDNYKWHCSNGTAVCAEGNNGCKAALCACDVAVVKCWSQYPKPKEKVRCNRTKLPPRPDRFRSWFKNRK